jgi:hypothetical protein
MDFRQAFHSGLGLDFSTSNLTSTLDSILQFLCLPSPKRAYATEGLLPAGGLRAGRSEVYGLMSESLKDFTNQ